jgi:hypothetical protein
MDAYHQSKHELDGLPHTVTEKIPVTNTPNIFAYRSYIFAKNPAFVRRFIKATKADVGGMAGHGGGGRPPLFPPRSTGRATPFRAAVAPPTSVSLT